MRAACSRTGVATGQGACFDGCCGCRAKIHVAHSAGGGYSVQHSTGRCLIHHGQRPPKAKSNHLSGYHMFFYLKVLMTSNSKKAAVNIDGGSCGQAHVVRVSARLGAAGASVLAGVAMVLLSGTSALAQTPAVTEAAPGVTATTAAPKAAAAPVEAPVEAPVQTPTEAPVPFAMSINGKAVPEVAYQMMLEEKTRQGKKEGPALEKEIRDEILTQSVLANEARKQGLSKLPVHVDAMEQIENRQLTQAYFARFVQTREIPEAALKADYERIVKDLGDRQYHVRQIISPTEEKARAVLAELAAGAKFAALGVKYPTAGLPKGGDMGWLNLSHMHPSVRTVVAATPENGYSPTPVQIGDRWHLVAVEAIRPFTAPAYDAVKANLELKAYQDLFDKHVKELRAQAVVK